MDDCDVTAALERQRSARVVDRILRGLSPYGHLLVSWFVMHHDDRELRERTNISAEIWGWDEELFSISLDRDLWFFEDDDGPELPDFSQHLRSRFRDLRGQENPLLGYDSGDGI